MDGDNLGGRKRGGAERMRKEKRDEAGSREINDKKRERKIKMKDKRRRIVEAKAIHPQSIDYQGSLSTSRHQATTVTHHIRSKSEAPCNKVIR